MATSKSLSDVFGVKALEGGSSCPPIIFDS